jgi:hypothetical protein
MLIDTTQTAKRTIEAKSCTFSQALHIRAKGTRSSCYDECQTKYCLVKETTQHVPTLDSKHTRSMQSRRHSTIVRKGAHIAVMMYAIISAADSRDCKELA